jgi:hypothetical protein
MLGKTSAMLKADGSVLRLNRGTDWQEFYSIEYKLL